MIKMKKILSLILVMAMCLSLMPALVLAEEEEDSAAEIVNESSGAELPEATEEDSAAEIADEAEEDSISLYESDENTGDSDPGDGNNETPDEVSEESEDDAGSIPVSADILEADQEEVASDAEEAPAEDGASVGLNVAYHTQEEIRSFALSHPIDIAGTLYTETPVLEAPYAAGEISDVTLTSALRALNLVRYIAGISANVRLDDDYMASVQAAALLQAANRQLSHWPSRPDGISDDLYGLGVSGSSQSNLAMGYPNLVSSVFAGWMCDGDSGNIDRVGHRRWILNPSMGKTGFGMVGAYTSIYAFDTGNSRGTETLVAWPAQNMPTALFDSSYPWSLSVGKAVNADAVTVTLTRTGDGKIWTFSSTDADGYFNVNNDGYGQTGCIIFRPEEIEYTAGDSFTVLITGAVAGDIIYTVDFFDMDNLIYAYENITDVTIPEGVTSIGNNAFSGYASLTRITIPEGVTSIGNGAFSGCTNLTSITIPEGITSIGNSAFYRCANLTSITIPEGVTSIGDYAFYGCESLTSITMPTSVVSIGDAAFFSFYSFFMNYSNWDVYYAGTEEQWNAIMIGDNNAALLNAKIHFNSTGEDAVDVLSAVEILQSVVGIKENADNYTPADAAKILSGLA